MKRIIGESTNDVLYDLSSRIESQKEKIKRVKELDAKFKRSKGKRK